MPAMNHFNIRTNINNGEVYQTHFYFILFLKRYKYKKCFEQILRSFIEFHLFGDASILNLFPSKDATNQYICISLTALLCLIY